MAEHGRGGEDGQEAQLETTIHRHVGRAQPKTTEEGRLLQWRRERLTVTLDASIEALGPSATDAVQRAFGSWLEAGPALPKLVFDRSGRSADFVRQDGVSRVSFGRIDIQGHEKDLAITATYSDPRTGEIVEADVLLNSRYAFAELTNPFLKSGSSAAGDEDSDDSDDDARRDGRRSAERGGETNERECEKVYDIESVVAHEAGHFFGLGEDMEDERATMYVRTSACDTQKRDLSPADIEVIQEMYGEAATSVEPAGVGPNVQSSCGVKQYRRGTPISSAGLILIALASLGARRRFNPFTS